MEKSTHELSPIGSESPKAPPPAKTTPRDDERAAVLAMRALKPAHRRILRVEMDPANAGSALEIKAGLAGTTRKTYSRVLARGDVQAAMMAAVRRMLAPIVPAVIAAAARSAQLEGREGYQDRKLLLGLAGVATEAPKRVEHSGAVTVRHGVGGALQRALLASREAAEAADSGSSAGSGPVIDGTIVEDAPESDTMPLVFED